jgi:hypothetical protein
VRASDKPRVAGETRMKGLAGMAVGFWFDWLAFRLTKALPGSDRRRVTSRAFTFIYIVTSSFFYFFLAVRFEMDPCFNHVNLRSES